MTIKMFVKDMTKEALDEFVNRVNAIINHGDDHALKDSVLGYNGKEAVVLIDGADTRAEYYLNRRGFMNTVTV